MRYKRGMSGEPIVIRKYANRRLYDTASGKFVTLADLHEMIKRGEEFVVREAKTDRDLTVSVLAQIVAEEAVKGRDLLPLGYLRRLLHLYHEGFGDQLSEYLERSMELFADNQRELLRRMSHPFDPAGALEALGRLGERNAEFLQRSFGMFAPPDGGTPPASAPPPSASASGAGSEIEELRAQLLALRQRLDALERGRSGGGGRTRSG